MQSFYTYLKAQLIASSLSPFNFNFINYSNPVQKHLFLNLKSSLAFSLEWLCLTIVLGYPFLSYGYLQELTPTLVQQALLGPSGRFVSKGILRGGDPTVSNVLVSQLELQKYKQNQSTFESLRIGLLKNAAGMATSLKRPSSFQISLLSSEKAIDVAIWGSPSLNLSQSQLTRFFKQIQNSELVKKVDLLPKIEDEVWIFRLHLKVPILMEVYEEEASNDGTRSAQILIEFKKIKG